MNLGIVYRQSLPNGKKINGPFMQPVTDTSHIRIALVEDEVDFQNALSEAIQAAPDMVLMGVANTRAEGLQLLDHIEVDVLLVDLGLPDGSGIDVILAAHKRWPACNIMVYTTFGDEMRIMRSLEAGATGYLLKDSSQICMMNEIRSLHVGGSPISPLIARQILMRFRPDRQPVILTATEKSSLSAREKEVLELITKGFTSSEIAGLLSVSRHTVLTYVRRIYIKLEVTSRTEAIYEARNLGILER